MSIINLTQHGLTEDQVSAGVVNPTNVGEVRRALTFKARPTKAEVKARAATLAAIASKEGAKKAMIGGAPYLMRHLEEALEAVGVSHHYAFSLRESVEKVGTDGTVVKVAVFRHDGFVEDDELS